ncbi:hypothetical protein [Candidatus Amoebophilus asiaticus]|nr:hypothetical protein [Candidatus Amoebophilus asiaticus]
MGLLTAREIQLLKHKEKRVEYSDVQYIKQLAKATLEQREVDS